MNNKIKGFVGFGFLVAGLALVGLALAPTKAPVAVDEPVAVVHTLDTVTIVASPEADAPVAKTAPKAKKVSRKTASTAFDMMHVPGLPHPVVDNIHARHDAPMTFEVNVQL